MKLIHITTVPETLGFLTGQVGFMKRQGFEVHVVSSPGIRLDRFCSREHIPGHPVEMTRCITPLPDMAALFRIWRIFRRIRPTIVHAHTPKAGLLGMLAAMAARVPVRMFEIHGLPYLTASGLRRRLLKWATGVACRVSHRVLCVSFSIRDLAVSTRLCPDRKITVPARGSVNGIDATGVFNPTRRAPDSSGRVRSRYGISGDSIVMGFVGRLVRDKGLVELSAAWTSLRDEFPNLEWLLVGDAEPHDPLPPNVLAQLRSDPRVHWTGWVDDLPELYGAMNLLVLPSYREGFPVVALEAAAMSLPIVATRVPGCVDAVEDGTTGVLVEPRNPRALAQAIRNYLRNPQLRTEHGEAGRRRVLRDFQPAMVWHAVEGEYLSLLRKKGLASPKQPAGPVTMADCEVRAS
jgi:glycosyltransferase involved in cell wall biosynthesis